MDQEDLRTIYIGYIRAKADYCSAVYLHSTAPSNKDIISTKQHQAARIITGCTSSTPIHSLEREANLIPISKLADIRAATAYEKHVRLPGHIFPTAELVKAPVTNTHLKKDRNWRKTASDISRAAGLGDLEREPLISERPPPWIVNTDTTFKDYIAGLTSTSTDEEKKRKEKRG